ncbi:tryptophan 2,3-dioxygenase family protein [Streptomyces ginkgonis]|uniref:tryptophan 2,3-dioxygenase family protein n=1 Tax=Streptomyces ginkgonis TaxID=1812259 RepID=UPI0021769981|nr:tryptophan 2,3-dioxygenase family protein [Streptomyces ginkgonis]
MALFPESCTRIIDLQSGKGRWALTETDRAELAAVHARTRAAAPGTEEELLHLLTRPFATEDIPEYFRYTSLHVLAWYLAGAPDQVAATLRAMDAALADLTAVEHAAGEDEERLRRLAALRAHLRTLPHADGPAAPVLDTVDAAQRERLRILVACTGFPMSDRHDEHVFLRAVHVCELAYYLIRHQAGAVVAAVGTPAASTLLARLTRYADLPNRVFHVLRTLTPESFMSFREATGYASAVQSLNYHLMELALYGHDPRKDQVLTRYPHLRPLTEPPLREAYSLRQAVAESGDPGLAGAWQELARNLLTWRGRHYGFGRRYLADIQGSGGTEGAEYLKGFVVKRAAPGGRTPVPVHFAYR